MSLQAVERERTSRDPRWHVAPITKTVSGFEGARIVTALSGGVSAVVKGSAWSSNATIGTSFVGVYYAGASDYDPEFVASILQADAAAPEASFNNVVDMLEWLNRDVGSAEAE
jgi:hypothetical protein